MRIRIILGSIGLAALSVLTFKAKAEEFKPYKQISVSVAAHKGGAENYSDIYGTPIMFGGSFGRSINKNLKIEGGLDYLSKDGDPYQMSWGDANISSASAHTSSLEINACAYFLAPAQKAVFYAGGGITHIGFKEELSVRGTIGGQSFNENVSASEGGWGLMLAGGIDVPVSPTASVFGQISYKSAKVKGDVQVGGTNFGGGVRLKF